jgi:DNA-binding ferritin-like protein (Dps family)
MSLQSIIEGKREWRVLQKRIKSLPDDYQIVFKEIFKYFYKVGPAVLNDGLTLYEQVFELFEEGVANGKTVIEITGRDVASFADDLIKDSPTYAEEWAAKANADVAKSIQKHVDKTIKKDKK